MSYECEFCNKNFSSKSSLNYHQKTVKYCLEIQKNKTLTEPKDNSEDFFKCEFCNKNFTIKKSLIRHSDI